MRILRGSVGFVVLVVGVALLPALQAGGATSQVSMANLAFSPATVTITAGDSVTWTNDDPLTHTVTADDASFDSGNVSAGGTFSHTFPTAGTFVYHCQIHGPSMSGTVVVEASTTTTSGTTPTTPTTTPPTTTDTAPSTTGTAPTTAGTAPPTTVPAAVAPQAVDQPATFTG